MIEYYQDLKEKNSTLCYFSSRRSGTIITLYQSGKVMFQGMSADVDYAMWRDLEMSLNKRDIDAELALKEAKKKKKKIQDL